MKKIPKETKKYIINELIKFLKNKEDREKRAIINAYFEKKKYEKTKKLN